MFTRSFCLLFGLPWLSTTYARAGLNAASTNGRYGDPGIAKKHLATRLYRAAPQSTADKYFHEATFNYHSDSRFAVEPLTYDQRREHLAALTRTYLRTMDDIGIETWIMHGSLLGWYWNRNVLPWDADIDVMVSEKSMHHLGSFYNMSMHHCAAPDPDAGRDYLLDINPHYLNDSTADINNRIDARWICTKTGLYIDITTLRQNLTAKAEGIEGAMMVKDRHHYMYDDVFPLRATEFAGVAARVPFAYGDLLAEEYGDDALTKTTFENHVFDTNAQEWRPLNSAATQTPAVLHVGYKTHNSLERMNDRLGAPNAG